MKEFNAEKFFVKILAILVISDIIMISTESTFEIPHQVYTVFVFYDLVICLILIPEFGYRLWESNERKKFVYNNNFDLIGMIPLILVGPLFAISRIFRLFRIVKILAKLKFFF